jgi:hypothetical protein
MSWLRQKGVTKEIISIFNERVIDWIDENPGTRILPEIVDVNDDDFTLNLMIFNEKSMRPIVSNQEGRVSVRFETPVYSKIDILTDCVDFLARYFEYDVRVIKSLDNALNVKSFDSSQLNSIPYQKASFRFAKKSKRIKKFNNFINSL